VTRGRILEAKQLLRRGADDGDGQPKLSCDWFDAAGGGDRCAGDEVVAAAMIDPFIMCVALRAEADMQRPIACSGGEGGRQITDSSADGESFLL